MEFLCPKQMLQTSMQSGAAADITFVTMISQEMFDFLDGRCTQSLPYIVIESQY